MHARQLRPLREDLSFLGGQLVESLADKTARLKPLGELDIGRVVSRFAFEKAGIEISEFRIATLNMFTKQLKTLAAPRFDQ